MSNTEESGAGMADTDINSTHPDGSGSVDPQSAVEDASGDDAGRGNLDGSNPVAEPRDRSLGQAGSENPRGSSKARSLPGFRPVTAGSQAV